MALFGVFILEKPTKAAADEGVKEKLILGPEWITADSSEAACYQVLMDAVKKNKPVPEASQLHFEVLSFK